MSEYLTTHGYKLVPVNVMRVVLDSSEQLHCTDVSVGMVKRAGGGVVEDLSVQEEGELIQREVF